MGSAGGTSSSSLDQQYTISINDLQTLPTSSSPVHQIHASVLYNVHHLTESLEHAPYHLDNTRANSSCEPAYPQHLDPHICNSSSFSASHLSQQDRLHFYQFICISRPACKTGSSAYLDQYATNSPTTPDQCSSSSSQLHHLIITCALAAHRYLHHSSSSDHTDILISSFGAHQSITIIMHLILEGSINSIPDSASHQCAPPSSQASHQLRHEILVLLVDLEYHPVTSFMCALHQFSTAPSFDHHIPIREDKCFTCASIICTSDCALDLSSRIISSFA